MMMKRNKWQHIGLINILVNYIRNNNIKEYAVISENDISFNKLLESLQKEASYIQMVEPNYKHTFTVEDLMCYLVKKCMDGLEKDDEKRKGFTQWRDKCKKDNEWRINVDLSTNEIISKITESHNASKMVSKFKEIDNKEDKRLRNNNPEDDYSEFSNRMIGKNIFPDNSATGHGKTFLSVNQFLKDIPKYNGIMNAVLIEPQKNMFLMKKNISYAMENNIPVLHMRSREDIINLDAINYTHRDCEKNLSFYEYIEKSANKYETELKKYNAKFKKIKSITDKNKKINHDFIEDDMDDENIKSSFLWISALGNKLKYYQNDISRIENSDNNEKDRNRELAKYKESFFKDMTNMANNLVMSVFFDIYDNDNIKENIENIENFITKDNKNDFEQFIYNVTCFFHPLDVAKYKSSLIFCTMDKLSFLQSIFNIVTIKDKYTLRKAHGTLIDFSCNIKNNIRPDMSFVMDVKTEDEQRTELKRYLESKEKDNFFTKNNIAFTFIIDEEHISYNKRQLKMIQNIVGRDEKHDGSGKNTIVNPEDSFSILCKWVLEYTNGPGYMKDILEYNKNEVHVVDNKLDTISNMKAYLIQRFLKLGLKYAIHDRNRLIKIITYFKEISFNGIIIRSSDKNMLHNLFSNIVYLTPKSMLHIDVMKNTFMELSTNGNGQSSLKIVSEKSDGHDYITLKEFFDLMVCMFLSCSSIIIKNDMKERNVKNVKNVLIHQLNEYKSDNEKKDSMFIDLLIRIMKKKRFFHGIENNMKLDGKININIFYTYLISKLCFAFKTLDKKEDGLVTIDNVSYTSLKLNVEILMPPPEFELYKILYRNKGDTNRVRLLSATRGFINIYSGNYNLSIFDKFNEILGEDISRVECVCSDKTRELTKLKFENKKSVTINSIKYDNLSSDLKPLRKTCKEYKINSIDTIEKDNVDCESKNELIQINKNLQSFHNGFNNYANALGGNHKKELLTVLNVIYDAISDRKNKICMTLTNKIIGNLRKDKLYQHLSNHMCFHFGSKFYKAPSFYESHWSKHPDMELYKASIDELDECNKHKVFLIRPDPNSEQITKIILYDAVIGRDPGLNNIMYYNKENTNVVLISSYSSAGTGLNLILNSYYYDDNKPYYTEIDFDEIVLAMLPYWTDINNSNTGFDHIGNMDIILRNVTDNEFEPTIDIFDDGLTSIKNMKILRRENDYNKLCAIIQAAGRIERRNGSNDVKITIAETVKGNSMRNAMLLFYNIHRDYRLDEDAKEKLENSLSVNAKSILKVSDYYINDISLTEDEEDEIIYSMEPYLNIISDFFRNDGHYNDYQKWLGQYRKGNENYRSFYDFNETLRSIFTPKDAENAFKKIEEKITMNTNYDNKLKRIIKHMFYPVPKNLNTKALALDDDMKITSFKNNGYMITDRTLYGYDANLQNMNIDKKNGIAYKLHQNIEKHNNELSDGSVSYLPVSFIKYDIQGNIAEKLIAEYLYEVMNTYDNKNIKIFKQALYDNDFKNYDMQFIYEKFDNALVDVVNKKILCIDVKNITNRNNKTTNSITEHYKDKIEDIEKTLFDYDIQYIYINIKLEYGKNNSIEQLLKRDNGKNALYTSLFEEVEYTNKNDERKEVEHTISRRLTELVKCFYSNPIKNNPEDEINNLDFIMENDDV